MHIGCWHYSETAPNLFFKTTLIFFLFVLYTSVTVAVVLTRADAVTLYYSSSGGDHQL